MNDKFFRHLLRVLFYDSKEKRVFVEIPSYKYDIAFGIPLDVFPDNMKENAKNAGYRFHAMVNTRREVDDLIFRDFEEK